MFDKVLIANRGEIAVRVIRACRDLGLRSVAVYSEADRGALHTKLADESVEIGPSPASQSYLDLDRIMAAAKESGAQAIHPGYGFLSESPRLARACREHGLTLIGPPEEAMAAMGDKVTARGRMQQAGVPVVPGTEAIEDPEEALAAAREIGYPILVKASAGGGGIGMRAARDEEELRYAISACQDSALRSFGDSRVFLERLVDEPRHIEIQVLADSHGNTIHLGERECSIQRRHQKLLEESPSTAVSQEMRHRMGEAAVRAAEAVGYVNAGTVEFIESRGSFFFLEMNTRLQVEHPVTELVTGLDLVEWQLRVASGEALGFTQQEVRRDGHAIEVRINAEDPAGGAFTPSPGTITSLVPPGGPGVRLDAGYQAGDTVSQFYDNLVAKLVVWGHDREAARRRMLRAIDETKIEGVATTLPADVAILAHEDFASATHSTNWVEQRLDLSEVRSGPGPVAPAGESEEARVLRDVTAEVDGRRYQVKLWVPDTGDTVVASGRTAVASRPAGGRRPKAVTGASGSGTVSVPMQGTIVKVAVSEGDEVEVGQVVCVLEAMKMENNVVAEKAGTVTDVRVSAGDSVGPGDVIAVIE